MSDGELLSYGRGKQGRKTFVMVDYKKKKKHKNNLKEMEKRKSEGLTYETISSKSRQQKYIYQKKKSSRRKVSNRKKSMKGLPVKNEVDQLLFRFTWRNNKRRVADNAQ